MNRNQLESRAYVKPGAAICALQIESLLQTLSGQHYPIHQGGIHGDAKQGWFEEEDEDAFTPSPSPSEEGSYPLWNE